MEQLEAAQKPVYQLIALDMAESIAGGHYQPGEKIHGRSTLASKYNVSPETVRRAMFLLKDMDIIEMRQGSGIFIKHIDKAQNFVEKFRTTLSAGQLKQQINDLTCQRAALDARLNETVLALLDSYERFSNLSPLTPFELPVKAGMALTGKNLADVNFWHNTGATIVGIRRAGQLILSPGPYAEFLPDDTFLLICDSASYARAKAYVARGE